MVLTITLSIFLYLVFIGITSSILKSVFKWDSFYDDAKIYICSAFCIFTLPVIIGILIVRFLIYRTKY